MAALCQTETHYGVLRTSGLTPKADITWTPFRPQSTVGRYRPQGDFRVLLVSPAIPPCDIRR
jgi:hypothetical protein